MRKKQESTRASWAVVAAALLVLSVLLAAFLTTTKGSHRNDITLPDQTIAPPPQVEEPEDIQDFLQVEAGNVQQILKTLQRPEAYHQTLTVRLYWPGGSGIKTVEQWRAGTFFRGQIIEAGRQRNVISDGKRAWVWYDTETQAAAFPLGQTRTLEDLIGVATFDTVMNLPADQIQVASFSPAQDDSNIHSITLRTAPLEAGAVQEFWIDVATQLLWKAEISDGDGLGYALEQTAFEQLESTDQTLKSLFTLPDGTALTLE